jgi:hypothetical protein
VPTVALLPVAVVVLPSPSLCHLVVPPITFCVP